MRSSKLAWLLLLAAVGCPGPDPTFVPTGSGGTGAGGGVGASGGGSCDPSACPPGDHAMPSCEGGQCALMCDTGFDDCNGMPEDGCEIDTMTDPDNCGDCMMPCALGCAMGMCAVPVDLSVGPDNGCVLFSDGAVWCWGHNKFGEHGDGTTTEHDSPVKVPLGQPAIDVVVGGVFESSGHACAVLADGTVQCWGNGALNGNAGFNATPSAPAPVSGLVNVETLDAGGMHTCALQDDDELFCWGDDTDGQIGEGTAGGTEDAGAINIIDNVRAFATGANQTCASTNTGALYCWGGNNLDQLGTGDALDHATPWVVSLTQVEELSAGDGVTCGRVADEMYCWGWDYNGGVGVNGCTGSLGVPTLVTVANPTLIATGRETNVAVSGVNGEIIASGIGPHPDAMTRCQHSGTGFTGVVKYDVSYYTGCAINTAGEVLCWGDDMYGGVGDGPDNGPKPMPVPVAFPRR